VGASRRPRGAGRRDLAGADHAFRPAHGRAAAGARRAGRARLFAVGLPAAAAPWIGYLAATAWIRSRTSHEEQEYAVDTAIAGTFGGGGVWLIALAFIVIRVVT
jgi:hypothetical protein